MKNYFGVRAYLMLLLFALGFSGCNEKYKSTTTINSDGSCERIIVVSADSSFIRNGFFHVPMDQSWHPEFRKLDKDTQKVFVAKKYFKDANSINDEYKDSSKAGVEIHFEKKFRWFFTYYTYSETYKAYSPFHQIPLNSFLTKEEYSKYVTGDTSAALKKRMDNYFAENIFEYLFAQLRASIKKLNDRFLTVGMLDSKKKEIHDKVVLDSFPDNKATEMLAEILKSKSVFLLEPEIKKMLADINEKLTSTDVRYEFTNEIIMPGIILGTNASSMEGSKAIWNFSSEKFLYINYSMTVESRLSNLWAVYVTAGIILVIIFLLLLPKFKRFRN